MKQRERVRELHVSERERRATYEMGVRQRRPLGAEATVSQSGLGERDGGLKGRDCRV